MTEAICWINGAIVPAYLARISVMDHGLLYGDGVFEGIRFYQRRAFRLQAHLHRLFRSAAALRLTIPLDATALTQAIHATIAAFELADGYLRLVVTRGSGRMGLDPSNCATPEVFIIADQLSLLSERVRTQGARVIIAATRRLGADGLDPRIKSLNYLNHILARMEAGNAGADEAILLNTRGHVAEGTADNLFIVSNEVLLTPLCSDGALEGITRAAVLEIASRLGMCCREMTLGPYDLYTADECFLTGTGAEIIPVREVDGRRLATCPGPIFQQINVSYQQLVLSE
jgi:branched-chain amino acid aminotransferase